MIKVVYGLFLFSFLFLKVGITNVKTQQLMIARVLLDAATSMPVSEPKKVSDSLFFILCAFVFFPFFISRFLSLSFLYFCHFAKPSTFSISLLLSLESMFFRKVVYGRSAPVPTQVKDAPVVQLPAEPLKPSNKKWLNNIPGVNHKQSFDLNKDDAVLQSARKAASSEPKRSGSENRTISTDQIKKRKSIHKVKGKKHKEKSGKRNFFGKNIFLFLNIRPLCLAVYPHHYQIIVEKWFRGDVFPLWFCLLNHRFSWISRFSLYSVFRWRFVLFTQ